MNVPKRLQLGQDRFSQNGEYSAIKMALDVIEGTCGEGALVEFGGGDGSRNSNLWEFGVEGRQVILIEADRKRFLRLEREARPHPQIHVLNAKVEESGTSSLSNLISPLVGPEKPVSVVCIDVDGDDVLLMEELDVTPELILCEFNPWMAIDVAYRQQKGESNGNSLAEVIQVARSLDMFPVCVSRNNLLVAKNSHKDKLEEIEIFEELPNLKLPRFAWAYDGTLLRLDTAGLDRTEEVFASSWTGIFLPQPLPARLRKFDNGNAKWLRFAHFLFLGLLTRPTATLKWLLHHHALWSKY